MFSIFVERRHVEAYASYSAITIITDKVFLQTFLSLVTFLTFLEFFFERFYIYGLDDRLFAIAVQRVWNVLSSFVAFGGQCLRLLTSHFVRLHKTLFVFRAPCVISF